MRIQLTPWEEAVNFHGHACPGLAVGYRAAEIALRELGATRSADEELIAIVENDSCAVDAIQSLTGSTFGKGNLFFRDYGKQVYTLGDRKRGEAIRLVVKGSALRHGPEDKAERVQKLLSLPEEEFCTFTKVNLEFPAQARIHKSLECAECGETVMETRARVKNGKPVCIPCAGV